MIKNRKIAIFLVSLVCIIQSGCAFSANFTKKTVTASTDTYFKDDATRTYINYEDGTSQGDNKETTILGADELSEIELSYSAELFLSDLSEKEGEVYKQIYKGLHNFEPQINITAGVVSKEEICSFIVLCTTTQPAVNYVGEEYTVSIDGDGYVSAIKINYSKTQEQAEAEYSQLEKRVKTIMSKLKDEWSDYDKVKYFHDVIIKNCTYNEKSEYAYFAYGALCKGEAVCEGYTKAMLMLCDEAGVGCIPVIGEGYEGGNAIPHIWNKIILNNIWYNFDLTWDDPVTNMGDEYIRYDYFAITDDDINRDHSTDENRFINYPSASSGENYFVRNGLYVENTENAVAIMDKAVNDAMSENQSYARIKCSDPDVYAQAYQIIFKIQNENGITEIFGILRDAVEINGYSDYSSQGYSEITNPDMYTLTVRLNRK